MHLSNAGRIGLPICEAKHAIPGEYIWIIKVNLYKTNFEQLDINWRCWLIVMRRDHVDVAFEFDSLAGRLQPDITSTYRSENSSRYGR